MEWLLGAWRATSATVHMYGVDFALASVGTETKLVWALPSHRATWLAFHVAVYSYLTGAAARALTTADKRIAEFHALGRELTEDQVLSQVIAKIYDDEYVKVSD